MADAGTETTFTIQGREIALPVEVRDARQWAVQYLVDADRAQETIGYSGLEVAQPFPGRTIVSLAFVEYLDSDLDAYHEVAVSFVVRSHDAPPVVTARDRAREFFGGGIGAFIHQLPVDQTFTLEAGVEIWGYPKFLAEIDIRDVGGRTICDLRHEGEPVLALDVKRGGPIRLREQAPPSYSFHDGVLRRTPWELWGLDRGARLGGAELELGTHPLAKELQNLGLPKRALMTATTGHLHAVFGAAEVVTART